MPDCPEQDRQAAFQRYMLAGDRIAAALEAVGLTPERLETFLGAPCGCEERKARFNELDLWARRVLAGKVAKAREYFHAITGGGE
jgi:hypothetical protein